MARTSAVRAALSFAIFILLPGCGGVLSYSPVLTLGNYPRLAQTSPLREGAAGVVLREQCRLGWIYDRNERRLDCHRATLVLDPSRIEAEGAVGGAGVVVALDGRTVAPDGRVFPLRPEHVKDLEVLSKVGREESVRRRTFAFSHVTTGSVLELRYTIIGHGIAYEHLLHPSLPVVEASFEVVHPASWTLDAAAREFAVDPTQSARGMATRRWVLRDFVPPTGEPMSLAPGRAAPSVRIAVRDVRGPQGPAYELVTWPKLGANLWAGIDARLDLDSSALDGLDCRAPGLVADVWARVTSKVRLHPHHLLTGDHGPRSAAAILESGLGNGDDRSIVILAMLKPCDVHPELALVPGEGGADFVENVAYVGNDVDLLVHLPERDLWLDPSCLACRPGTIAVEHQGRTGLVFAPLPGSFRSEQVRAKLEVTPVDPWTARDGSGFSGALVLEDHGLVATKIDLRLSRETSSGLRTFFELRGLAPSDREKRERRFIPAFDGGALTISGLDAPTEPVVLHLEGARVRGGALTETESRVLVAIDGLARIGWLEQLAGPRRRPVELPPVPAVENDLSLAIPGGFTVSELPSPVELASKHGRYALRVVREDARVHVTETLVFDRRTLVEPADLEELGRFAARVVEARHTSIVFARTAAGAGLAARP